MKAIICLLLVPLLLMPAGGRAGEAAHPIRHEFLALMAYGGSQGGGDEAAFIDARGGVYYIDMAAEDLYWRGDETLAMLAALGDTYKIGELTASELVELEELIDSIGEAEPVGYGISACDAGTYSQVVYRATEGGDRREIELMTAGDTVSENMDPAAIKLSSMLLDMMDFSRRLGRWSHLFPYGDSVPLSLSFERGSFFGGSRAYTLRRSGDRLRFEARGTNGDDTDIAVEIDDASGLFNGWGIAAELQRLISKLGIDEWNGFDESDSQILDGDGFALRIDYGARVVEARGYERYPDGYQEALGALEAFFGKLMLRAQ